MMFLIMFFLYNDEKVYYTEVIVTFILFCLHTYVDASTNNGMVTCNTVYSSSTSGMEIGQQFDTAKEVMEYVTDFAKRCFHPLRRSSCTTVEAYNRKVSTGMIYWQQLIACDYLI